MAHPSADPINPDANRWLKAFLPKKQREAAQAAQVQRLAAQLGMDAEELAKRIPEDTLRRLKFPLIEQPQADGTTGFKHDLGITEGVRPLLGTDRAHGPIQKSDPAPIRDESGKFSK